MTASSWRMLAVLVTVLHVLDLSSGRRVYDLTHTLDENAPKYPLQQFGVPPFNYYGSKSLIAKYLAEAMWYVCFVII